MIPVSGEGKYNFEYLCIMTMQFNIILIVMALVLAVVVYAYFDCRAALRRERKKTSMFYSISKDLEGDTWVQKDKIQGQQEEIESLEAEVRESREMARMLRQRNQRRKESGELIAFTERLLLVTDELANIYLESASRPETLGRRVKEVLDSTVADRSTFAQVGALMEASYPGFLNGLYSEYPWLTEEDRQLVALMCCGISPNAVSVIFRMDMNRLNKWKTRLAKRMESPVRLSKFLNEKLLAYHA